MTKDDIIKLAREAECEETWGMDAFRFTIEQLERFAALVIKPWAKQLEVERKRFQELNDIVAVGMQHARADEREACAQLCEDKWRTHDEGDIFAAAIRARGN